MNRMLSEVVKATLDRRSFIKSATLVSLATPSSLIAIDGSSNETLLASQRATSDAELVKSPYGVCAHVGAGEELAQAPQNLQLMKEAGIRWIRADFSWFNVEYSEGKWEIERLDKIVDETGKLGLQLLPILDYDVPWATPAYKHLDKWLEYVTRVVKRYKYRIQYWEVWNEENLKGFWHEDPDATNYATLLKETNRVIKEIDPNLKVVYGGLAGVPADYFEKSLAAGAGEAFDVVNIHPYRGGITTIQRLEQFTSDIDKFRQALRKYNLPEKPIWITEMGWATPPTFGDRNKIILGAIKKLFPNKSPRVAFFYDERYEQAQSRTRADFYQFLPEHYANNNDLTLFLDADGLKDLTVEKAEILIMPPSETFPADCFDAMVQYVKGGGTLVLSGGVPLYYESRLDEKTNRYVQSSGNPNFEQNLAALRINWFAWWTRQGVPETVPAVVASESADVFAGYNPIFAATRFFDDAKLKDGDKMISLIDGKNEDFQGSTACIYDFNSDYKGALVLSSTMGDDSNTNRSTVANQAVFLSQAYLLAFANGIERFFWYEFQAPERDDRDPEHHFGIVGGALAPKPGYIAYKTLTKARPALSEGAKLTLTGNVCVVSWKRPDGQNGWALWTLRNSHEITVKIDGKVTDAYDYLGVKVTPPSGQCKLNVTSGILYLIGPNNVKIL